MGPRSGSLKGMPRRVVYVRSEEQAAAIVEKIERQRKQADLRAVPGLLLSLMGVAVALFWTVNPSAFVEPVRFFALYTAAFLFVVGGAWCAIAKKRNLILSFIGPLAYGLKPQPDLPSVVVDEPPGLLDDY